ncbi:toll-like receptor 4 [Pecten maximus]|uniref:toll-like receptor 4 n=1 Tax=Pecten maximus TaxID=6579 RepID=UPI001457E760|nr:toll-like receptor 4 [Pecten maximus]
MCTYMWFAVIVLTEHLCTAAVGPIPNCTVVVGSTLDTDRTLDTGRTLDIVHGHTTNSENDNNLNSTVMNVYCLINEGDNWNFSLVREWTAAYGAGPVHVSITCKQGGSVYLRRPIKADHLELLRIHACNIVGMSDTDFSAELQQKNYSIRQLVIEDSVIEVLLTEIWRYYMDDAEKNREIYPCGYPQTLEELTIRNTNFKYIRDMSLTNTKNDELMKKILQYNTRKHQCIYNNLLYLEYSGTSSSSKDELNEQFLYKCIYPSLKVMNISRLLLTRAPEKLSKYLWHIDFPELELIDLSHNRITDIDFASPPPKGKRIAVDLSNNKLSILHRSSIQNVKNFYPGVVNLRGNQWVCNCSQQDFVKFLQEEEGAVIDGYAYLGEAKCSRPVSTLGQYLKNAKNLCGETSDNHLPSLVLYVCLPLLVLCFVVLIVLVRFRREIRVLVFTRFTSVNTCLFVPVPTKSERAEKDFDAFVSYSSLDETWVYDLCRRLEESAHEFRLCLHHKHFVPGACISDNIIDSVERSRHTIMVLSPNFLKSEWCILEFRKAFHQSLMENERHLVVVMLEGFDESSVHSDMKHFLKTYTYLKASDFFFMDKLVYALSKNRDNTKNTSRHVGSAKDQMASKALISVVKSV